jgi:hypothetical protein
MYIKSMKLSLKWLPIVLVLPLWISCHQYISSPNESTDSPSSRMLILKIKFDTIVFEGAYEMKLNPLSTRVTNIPLTEVYESSGDGSVITYKYLSDTVFCGGIIWMGTGKIKIPRYFCPTDSFKKDLNGVSIPKNIHYYHLTHYFDSRKDSVVNAIWPKISNLAIVKNYLNKGALMGLYFYTPTIGAFNPEPAKWIIFLYQP